MAPSALLSPAPLLLLCALLAAPAAIAAGRIRPAWAAPAGGALAVAAFACAVWGRATGGDRIDVAWAPSWDLRLAFSLDGLAGLYALLATGIGAAVVLYAARYLPLHLEHQGRPQADLVSFFASLLLFLGAMVGLVMAEDLLLLFVFWDLTAVASYLLIGYDHDEDSARGAALMALLVTGISAVCFLIGALLLHAEYDTFQLPELFAAAEAGRTVATAGLLIAVSALAKSAQVPLHFWLPRAMAAPTPVSAYLHSAAMVAAGVFLLGRVYPLLMLEPRLLDGLLAVGLASMAVGGVLALTRGELKQVLAYSTVSQYGYVVTMLGLGGEAGVAGASFYVLAHALAKSALFLTAGAVTEATGETRLARLGGLWREMPVLAAGGGAAAAGLAALPLTAGFFKDELFFAAALERGPVFAAMAVAGAALTFAYTGRFWAGIFLGPLRTRMAHRLPWELVAPVAALGALTVAFGIVVRPLAAVAEAAAEATRLESTPVHPAYHLDARAENLLALATFGLGGALLATRRVWFGAASAVARAGELAGPARTYARSLRGLNVGSSWLRRAEVRDLRSRIASILAPAGLLVAAALVATRAGSVFAVGKIGQDDLPLLLILTVAAGAAIATTLPTDHLSMALVLSGVGFSLAVAYAFFGAPDVALVAVLIETIFALLFLGVLALLPRRVLREADREPPGHHHAWRDTGLAVVAGLIAFTVAWGSLSRPAARATVAVEQGRLTPDAHAKDIVTAILADFRGLDTMGEVTVIGIGLLGIASLLRRGRLR